MPTTQVDILDFQARRVISGLDENGRSTIVVDEQTAARTATNAFALCDIWRVATVPVPVDAPDLLEAGDVAMNPPPEGVVVRVSMVPPDHSWDLDDDYVEALKAIGLDGDPESEPAETPGMHATDTVDILTILSGELHAVLETTETVLRPGDTFVQRGTKHTWANRGDEPVITVVTMVGGSAARRGSDAPSSAPRPARGSRDG